MKNPLTIKVIEHLEEHPDTTMLGFGWSIYWRWTVTVAGIIFVLSTIINTFAYLIY